MIFRKISGSTGFNRIKDEDMAKNVNPFYIPGRPNVCRKNG
jgi:hypothetical protein